MVAKHLRNTRNCLKALKNTLTIAILPYDLRSVCKQTAYRYLQALKIFNNSDLPLPLKIDTVTINLHIRLDIL